MVALSKIVGGMACVCLLCLGLSTAAQADNAAAAAETGSGTSTDSKTITGEVLRVEGNDCFIKGQDGKEVRLHIDTTTLKARNIEPGERIEAKVDDQNHVIAILSDPAVTDRRNDKQ